MASAFVQRESRAGRSLRDEGARQGAARLRGQPSRPDTTRLLDWPPASRVAHAARSSVAACSTDSGS